MSNKFVRVVAIVLAVLMAGGVFAAVLQVFACRGGGCRGGHGAALLLAGNCSADCSCCADCTLHHHPKGVEEKINAPPRMLIR